MKNLNLQDTAKTKTAEDVRQRYNLDVIKNITSKQTNSGCAVGIGKKAAVSKGLDVAGKIICNEGFYNSSGGKVVGTNYGICNTAAATAAKTVTIGGFELITGTIAIIKFANSVPANATLNIDSTGAKAIYNKGAAIIAGVIPAGIIALLVYNGSQYDLLSIPMILKEGDSNGWHYKKWSDGYVECWRQYTVSTAITGAWGGTYIAGAIGGIAFPVTFQSAPHLQVTVAGVSGDGAWYMPGGAVTATNTGAFYLVRGAILSNAVNFSVNFYANGLEA